MVAVESAVACPVAPPSEDGIGVAGVEVDVASLGGETSKLAVGVAGVSIITVRVDVAAPKELVAT